MTIPSSGSLIFDVKSTGSELPFARVLWLGLGLRTFLEDFGLLRESSEMIVSFWKNPSTPRIKISRLYLRKCWQVYNKCSQFKITWQEVRGTTEIISYRDKIGISHFHKCFPMFSFFAPALKTSEGNSAVENINQVGFCFNNWSLQPHNTCVQLFSFSLPHLLQTSCSNLHTFEFFGSYL